GRTYRGRGSTFVKFEALFDLFVQELNLHATPSFNAQLAILKKSIVDYRNKRVDHLADFGRGRGIKSGGDAPTRTFWHPHPKDPAEIETEPLDKVLSRIQDYLAAFIDFVDRNLDKSPLPRKPRVQE